MYTINTILFNNFETLDVFGPIEIWGRLPEHFQLGFYSREGGLIRSSQNVQIMTNPFHEMLPHNNILFIPGGEGTRSLVKDNDFITQLTTFAEAAAFILTVCTGSILFSKTGLLDGKKATSNKRVFKWTALESPRVDWIKKARWVKDGNIYTSSGVSAGMDMALGFVADLLSHETAQDISREIEYDWKENREHDPFASLYE